MLVVYSLRIAYKLIETYPSVSEVNFKYKKRILGGSILFVILSLFTRNLINENLTSFEIYFSSGSIALFILILIQNSNYKSKTRVQ